MLFLIFSQFVWTMTNLTDTEFTTRIGKLIPITVSISTNLVVDPIFLCKINHHDLVSSFIDSQDNLAKREKAQRNMKFFQVETTRRSKHAQNLEIRNKTHRIDIGEECLENDSHDASSELLQMQQTFDLQDNFQK